MKALLVLVGLAVICSLWRRLEAFLAEVDEAMP